MSESKISSFFCPPVDIWAYMICTQHVMIDANEIYLKKSCHNRYFIINANGLQMLSIPLQKRSKAGVPICELRISYEEPWSRKHIQAVRSAYGKSPFFEYYFDEWEKIMKSGAEYLADLNFMMMTFFNNHLGTNLNICISERNATPLPEVNFSFFNHFAIPEFFSNQGFYSQIWQERFGFIHNLSIIDLLFCCGPESVLVLEKIRKIKTKP